MAVTLQTIWDFRRYDEATLIIASNGIGCADDVWEFYKANVQAVGIGSVAFTRWWKMRDIIDAAYSLFCPA